ncbi:MAG: FecR family protein, partial [Planctomycetota bacterium]
MAHRRNLVPLFLMLMTTGLLLCEDLAAAEAAKVGVVVNMAGKVTAQQPGQEKRALSMASPIYLGDILKTKSKSKLEVMFNDHTSFTLGPKAKMTVDSFVYKAGDRASKCETSVTQGAFKVISGKITKIAPGNLKIKTSAATIGIRGTTVLGNATPPQRNGAPGQTTAVMTEGTGADVFGPGGQTANLRRPGHGVTATQGRPMPPVRTFSQNQINQLAGPVTITEQDKQEGENAPGDDDDDDAAGPTAGPAQGDDDGDDDAEGDDPAGPQPAQAGDDDDDDDDAPGDQPAPAEGDDDQGDDQVAGDDDDAPGPVADGEPNEDGNEPAPGEAPEPGDEPGPVAEGEPREGGDGPAPAGEEQPAGDEPGPVAEGDQPPAEGDEGPPPPAGEDGEPAPVAEGEPAPEGNQPPPPGGTDGPVEGEEPVLVEAPAPTEGDQPPPTSVTSAEDGGPVAVKGPLPGGDGIPLDTAGGDLSGPTDMPLTVDSDITGSEGGLVGFGDVDVNLLPPKPPMIVEIVEKVHYQPEVVVEDITGEKNPEEKSESGGEEEAFEQTTDMELAVFSGIDSDDAVAPEEAGLLLHVLSEGAQLKDGEGGAQEDAILRDAVREVVEVYPEISTTDLPPELAPEEVTPGVIDTDFDTGFYLAGVRGWDPNATPDAGKTWGTAGAL